MCAYLTTEHVCAPYSPHTSFQTAKLPSRSSHHTQHRMSTSSSTNTASSGDKKPSESPAKSSWWSLLFCSKSSQSTSAPSTRPKDNKSLNGAALKHHHMSYKKPKPVQVETISTSSSSDSANGDPTWTKSDQYLAFGCILALVLFAFLIAFVVNTVYTSYSVPAGPETITHSEASSSMDL